MSHVPPLSGSVDTSREAVERRLNVIAGMHPHGSLAVAELARIIQAMLAERDVVQVEIAKLKADVAEIAEDIKDEACDQRWCVDRDVRFKPLREASWMPVEMEHWAKQLRQLTLPESDDQGKP